MGEVVGLDGEQGLGREAKRAADGSGSAVAGGEDVYVGVADHQSLSGGDGLAGQGAGLCNESKKTVRIWFFGMEAVAAVVLKEEA